MPGPNLLDALKHHLATGETPESIRETLGGSVRTVPIEGDSVSTSGAGYDPFATPPSRPRRTAGPRDTLTTSSQRFTIEELEGGAGNAGPSEAFQPRVTPAGEVEPPLPFRQVEVPAVAQTPQPPAVVVPTLSHAQRKRDWQEAHSPRDSRDGGAAYPTRVVSVPRPVKLTTDQTLTEDLAASLALGEGLRDDMVEATGLAVTRTPWVDDAVDHAGAMAEALGEDQDAPQGAEGSDAPAEGTAADLPSQNAPLLSSARQAGDTGSPTPSPCEIPTQLGELPQFAYVCGPAGVGKTYWAKELARNSGDAVVLAATTGIASVNLGEGTTINSLLKYFDTASLRDAFTSGYLEATLKKHRNLGLERILLDEVSMMAGEQLTIITRALDNVNEDKPEGVPEMGLILLGDFAQLAPVPDRDPRDPRGFKKLPVAFAFESAEWERYEQHTLKLTKIRRQADRAFVEALQAVRRGAVGQALEYFRDRLVQQTDMQFQGPTIVAKNDAVSKYNQLRLDAVQGEKREFTSTRWGKVRPEWGAAPKPEHEWGVPPVLKLKEGCRVMILANKNLSRGDEPPVWAYTNGDLGTFIAPIGGEAIPELGQPSGDPTGARVKLDRTGTEVVVGYLNRFNEIPLEPGRRKALKAEGHPERVSEDGKKEYIGGIVYVPLRLAYCTTVHKSQGLSLDQVQIAIRDPFFAQPGMLYVALSRARTVEGLRLVGTPEGFRARCTVNPKLKGYL